MSEQIPQPPVPVSEQEARQWAMISHLSVLINLFTVFMGTVVPLIIYFLYKDRSKFVAFHAMQSFVMQVVCFLGGGIITVVSAAIGGTIIPLIGSICGCLFGIMPLAGLIYGIYGGMQVNQGKDFKYPVIGDLVQNNMK
ncbi:MAG: Chloroplast import component protein (Tic20) [Chloroflexi bacterium OLB14]|nr:MAG: Chloroplast import component protein (Tic20) [Chloroflexi bacterium OLB14]